MKAYTVGTHLGTIYFPFDTYEINLREMISRVNQAGSQLGKKYF